MLVRTFTAINQGLETHKVEVEINTSFGKPAFIIIGLANKVLDESRERISSSLLSCGVRIRSKKTVVNLAPADLKKTSSSVELAIAVAMLKLYKVVKINIKDTLFLGELSLDGRLKKVKGILGIVLSAKKMGFKKIFFPLENLPEISFIKDLEFYPLSSLKEFIFFTEGKVQLNTFAKKKEFNFEEKKQLRLEDVFLQEHAKKALTLAAAGGHNLLMIGPPGIGKTILAKSILSILPDLDEKELLEVNRIYSICGLLHRGLKKSRPFRMPHHGISDIALIGGGLNLQPGEITLAHRGILFLDELNEFKRNSIESLRKVLSDKMVEISRTSGKVFYPANFILIATANPCPCGFFASQKKCSCSNYDLKRYQKKLSGPILDRIDMTVRMDILENSGFLKNEKDNFFKSSLIKKKIMSARKIQRNRYVNLNKNLNVDLDLDDVQNLIIITRSAKQALDQFSNKKRLSTRSYLKIIKVAQTVADLEGSEKIYKKHFLEALSFRDLT